MSEGAGGACPLTLVCPLKNAFFCDTQNSKRCTIVPLVPNLEMHIQNSRNGRYRRAGIEGDDYGSVYKPSLGMKLLRWVMMD